MAIHRENIHSEDVDRLFGAAGINPSAYVQFERSQAGTSPAAKTQPGGLGSQTSGSQAPGMCFVAAHAGAARESATIAVENAQSSRAPDGAGLISWLERISRTPRANRPMRIVLGSTAAETGKTTIASALAGLFVHREQAALLIDHSANNGAAKLLGSPEEHFGSVSFGSEKFPNRSFPLLSEYWQGVPCDDFAQWRDLLTMHSRVTFLDGVEASAAAIQQLLQDDSRVLIPVLPNMMSAIDAVRLNDALDVLHPDQVHFLLNRYDASQALHREVRSALKMHLGNRLLPVEIEEDQLLQKVACSGRFDDEEAQASRAIGSLRQLADWLDCEPLDEIADGEKEEEIS
jgi:cellulose biosynthesis protein BcsQ